jgi:putative PIG3 family NAD(P)H quinone oxidoreductase
MRYVAISAPGGPEVLQLAEGPQPVPQGSEVLIAVQAAGVNRPDLLQRAGKYPPPEGASPILGLEVAGTVVARGPAAALAVGDRVCALVPGGGYAEFCLAPDAQCLPVPAGCSPVEAAGIPETFFTVWANLFQIGRLQAGERVLVHGGASGIGTTAIQLAAAFGAEVYATAGSAEKCAACLSLGAKAAINYRAAAFVDEVQRLTAGRGVNVVLDIVAGPYTALNLRCLATEGRLVQVGAQQGAEVTLNWMRVMQKRLTLTGSTMRPRPIADKARIARELRAQVWPLLESRQVRVLVDRVFPLAEVRQAHEHLERGRHIGKVILQVRPDEGPA